MKKKKVQKTVSVSLASSILLSSCSPQNILNYGEIEEANNKQMQRVSKRSKQSNEDLLSSCLLPLSEEDKQLITLCINLTNDILQDKDVAARFSENPQSYFAEKGYTYTGDFNSGLIQLALAAADEDIRKAVENQNAKLFINLCIQKGLLSIPSNLDITKSDTSQSIDKNELSAFLSSHGYDLLLNNDGTVIDNEADIAVEGVALLYVAGIVVVAALVAVGLFVFACIEGEIDDIDKPIEKPIDRPIINPGNLETSPLSLWLFNSSANTIDAPISIWVETQYNLIDEILMENYPPYANNAAYRAQLGKIIKANLWSYIL